MPRLVAGFAEKQPGVQLDLREGTMTDLHHLIRSGGSELMIAYDLDIARDITVTPLRSTRPYVLLPPDHRLARSRKQVELEQLVAEPLVLLDQPQPSKYFLGLFDAAGLTPTIGHRTSSFEMVRSLVARSLGYSLLIQRPAIDASYEGLPVVCLPLVRPAAHAHDRDRRGEGCQADRGARPPSSSTASTCSTTDASISNHPLEVGCDL